MSKKLTNARFLQQLRQDYPDFVFTIATRFAFRPPHTIVCEPLRAYPPLEYALLTLHELAHALCQHQDYQTDVQRLKMESEAWQRAKQLVSRYHSVFPALHWDNELAEGQLDTYRDWLHTKSLCKKCSLTRFQTPDGTYHCPQCDII